LCKHSNLVNMIDVRYNVSVRVFMLKKESAEVGLAAFHHFFDGGDDCGVAYDDDCFVTAWKQRATGNWKCEDLGINVWNGVAGYGT
jgi:hypothetical protein